MTDKFDQFLDERSRLIRDILNMQPKAPFSMERVWQMYPTFDDAYEAAANVVWPNGRGVSYRIDEITGRVSFSPRGSARR